MGKLRQGKIVLIYYKSCSYRDSQNLNQSRLAPEFHEGPQQKSLGVLGCHVAWAPNEALDLADLIISLQLLSSSQLPRPSP